MATDGVFQVNRYCFNLSSPRKVDTSPKVGLGVWEHRPKELEFLSACHSILSLLHPPSTDISWGQRKPRGKEMPNQPGMIIKERTRHSHCLFSLILVTELTVTPINAVTLSVTFVMACPVHQQKTFPQVLLLKQHIYTSYSRFGLLRHEKDKKNKIK